MLNILLNILSLARTLSLNNVESILDLTFTSITNNIIDSRQNMRRHRNTTCTKKRRSQKRRPKVSRQPKPLTSPRRTIINQITTRITPNLNRNSQSYNNRITARITISFRHNHSLKIMNQTRSSNRITKLRPHQKNRINNARYNNSNNRLLSRRNNNATRPTANNASHPTNHLRIRYSKSNANIPFANKTNTISRLTMNNHHPKTILLTITIPPLNRSLTKIQRNAFRRLRQNSPPQTTDNNRRSKPANSTPFLLSQIRRSGHQINSQSRYSRHHNIQIISRSHPTLNVSPLPRTNNISQRNRRPNQTKLRSPTSMSRLPTTKTPHPSRRSQRPLRRLPPTSASPHRDNTRSRS